MKRTYAVAKPVMNIDIQVEHWPIDRLIPKVNNPRTHSLLSLVSTTQPRSPAIRNLGVQEVPSSNLGGPTIRLNRIHRQPAKELAFCDFDCDVTPFNSGPLAAGPHFLQLVLMPSAQKRPE